MLTILVSIVVSCKRNYAVDDSLNEAENVMVEYPDSALSILKEIDMSMLKSKAEQARYGLLMSQALDIQSPTVVLGGDLAKIQRAVAC